MAALPPSSQAADVPGQSSEPTLEIIVTTPLTRGLGEVNTAVTQMDQVIQQNAAMVEQMTAAAGSLGDETDALSELIARDRVDERSPTSSGRHTAERKALAG